MTKTIDDNNCLDLLKKNDAAAWKYLIRIYFPVLRRLAQKIISNPAEAEDIVTDVFVKLWEQNAGFSDFQHIKKHLYVATRNSCLNHLRSKQREKNRHEAFANSFTTEESDYESEILYSELLAEIRKEINEFPARMREVFILAYFKKMSNEEIAHQLQLSNQTVRNQKATALNLLRKALKPRFSIQLILLALTIKGGQ